MANVVEIAEDLAPRFYHGPTTVGTSVVQVIDKKFKVYKGIQLKADPSNTGIIYIGNSSVSTSDGFPLEAGDGLFVPIEDITKTHAISDTAAQDLRWFAI